MNQMSNNKNILITSLLLETKKFLTVEELVICCSLNKQNEKELSQISRYVRKILSLNMSVLVEEKEMYMISMLLEKILYQCHMPGEMVYDTEPSDWEDDDYNFAVKHFDFMRSRRKLYPILCLVELFSIIRKKNVIKIPRSKRIGEIIRFSRDCHPEIFNEFQGYMTPEIFNRRLLVDNEESTEYDFLLIHIVSNIALKVNGYGYLPIELSEMI